MRIRDDFTCAWSLPAVECTDCCDVVVTGAGSSQVTKVRQHIWLDLHSSTHLQRRRSPFRWGEISPGYKGNRESAPCVLSVSEIARN